MTPALRITLRQLRAFAQAYRMRNLTHAAETLHITQSAMSALILQLEESLGVQLFERTPRMLRPTAAADDAFAQADEILSRAVELQLSMKQRSTLASTSLSLSCVPALASAAVASVIPKFESKMPNVKLVIYDEMESALIDHVLSRKAEFSISSFSHDPDAITQVPIVDDFLSVVCNSSCGLARKETVYWSDLLDYPIINLFKGATVQELVARIFPIDGRQFEPAYEIGYIQTALAMVAQAVGVVILPGYFAKGNPQFTNLVVRKLNNPEVNRTLFAHTRKGHVLSEAANVFLDLLREQLNSQETGPDVASSSLGR
jgi:LysR family transcriptional regulator, carnitine catabolism transcriptional activator